MADDHQIVRVKCPRCGTISPLPEPPTLRAFVRISDGPATESVPPVLCPTCDKQLNPVNDRALGE